MKTVGIICEYNPFHLGHARQFRLIRDQLGLDARIVCVMSGNYVQRGLPAMWDKSVRAASAMACGADLVLELPITGVLQSAEGFARTGVEILTRLGCVELLSFGAECGSGERLMELAATMDLPDFQTRLKENLDRGLPYAAARQSAVHDKEDILRYPNNILGLEYCRAIRQTGSKLQPLVITRNGDYHAVDADLAEPSATAVRGLFPDQNWNDFVPDETIRILKDAPWYDLRFGERALLARLRSLSDEEWSCCAHGSEGLWCKAMEAARTEATFEDMIHAVKSKRYPRTRIQRLFLCAYLGITDSMLRSPSPYVRILGASPDGRRLLREAKKQEQLILINAGETPEDAPYYRMECRASDLFTLFAAPEFPALCKTEEKRRILL